VEDLVDAFLLARKHIRKLSGQVFNIGGGPLNTTSLLELLDVIAGLKGKRPRLRWDNWRPGDQRYYVTNFSKFQTATGWSPQVGMRSGIEQLYRWLIESRENAPNKAVAVG
jgi:CDP-paratose 2-epimerase